LCARRSHNYGEAVRDDAVRLLRDSFYVTVGFGVLALQKMQVRRRELERAVDEQLGRLLRHET
jgi:hypothetical protein